MRKLQYCDLIVVYRDRQKESDGFKHYKLFGPSQTEFSMYTQAAYNNKHLAYWKLGLVCPKIISEGFTNGA